MKTGVHSTLLSFMMLSVTMEMKASTTLVMVTLRVGFYETEAKEDTKSLQEDQEEEDIKNLKEDQDNGDETNHEEEEEQQQVAQVQQDSDGGSDIYIETNKETPGA